MLAVASHICAIVDTNKPVKQLVGAGVGAGGMAGLQPAARAKSLANICSSCSARRQFVAALVY